MLILDISTYNKAARHKPGHGYSARPGGAPPRAILVHATHGHVGSSFAAEATYLLNSPDVSAHYLIGRQGQCAELLSPAPWAAWHSGDCAPNVFENATSVGVELHAATSESITPSQIVALTTLVQRLMWLWNIPADAVARHGSVAVPPGRKSDPATWPEAAFARWRASLKPLRAGSEARHDPTAPLATTPPPTYKGRWRLLAPAWVRAAPWTKGPKLGGTSAG